MPADPLRPPRAPRRITGRGVLLGFVAFFGTIAAMNAVMITLAVGSFPGLEVDSSYRVGLAYPEELARARVQAGLGWHVTAHAEPRAEGVVDVTVGAVDADGAPLSGLTAQVLLKRPAAEGLDRQTELAAVGAGRYEGRAVDVAPGVYDLVVTLGDGGGRNFRSVNRIVLTERQP